MESSTSTVSLHWEPTEGLLTVAGGRTFYVRGLLLMGRSEPHVDEKEEVRISVTVVSGRWAW